MASVADRMRQSLTRTSPLLRSLGYSLGFAVLWLIVAALRPASTFHLAPLLVAGTAPVFGALEARQAATPTTLAGAAGLGTAVALAATAATAAAGWLTGPSLLPTGGAALEAVVFSIAGGIGGWLIGSVLTRKTILPGGP